MAILYCGVNASERGRPSYYRSFYCEENVWRLLQDSGFDREDAHALFISSDALSIPMHAQRSAPRGAAVVWDYHVVAVARSGPQGKNPRAWEVWDMDSRLPFPTDALVYLSAAFRDVHVLPPQNQPRFRWAARPEFLARFASDRSHMRDPDGSWKQAPPEWPPIRTAGETMNLWRWVDTRSDFVGETFDLAGLRSLLTP